MTHVSLPFILVSMGLSVTQAEESEDTDSAEDTAWDVSAPTGLETREIPIQVDEGSWMSVDVSPDGSKIAFDLLGDIYVMSAKGGDATNVSAGLPWEIQPRFSPDGQRLAFTSDRGGGDNIWIMDADGENRQQITDESFRLMNSPSWHSSGEYIASRKHFTTSRSMGTGEIWLTHLAGGSGVALVERPNKSFQKEQGEPTFSVDGRYVYFTKNTTGGNRFEYAQDSNTDLFQIRRYELETGDIETVVSGAGGAVRPQPSPDGRSIAFVRRHLMQSQLWVKDFASGTERMIYADLDRDNQETWAVYGVYPNMDWLPDSSAIVFWAGGKIRQVDVESGDSVIIPFSVDDSREVIDPPRHAVAVEQPVFHTKMPRFASVSPDGTQVIFESLGRLYIKDTTGGAPKLLTKSDGSVRELFPAWSRDGRSIVYVTWDDQELGSIRTLRANGRGQKIITSEPGHYRRPQFSPDGATICFEKDGGGFLTSPQWSETTGIYRVSVRGGEPVRVSESGENPHFGSSNERVYFSSYNGDNIEFVSVDLSGHERRVHATSGMISDYLLSPDGGTLAFRENYDAYVMPMPLSPTSVGAGRSASAVPVTEVSGDGATYLSWSEEGSQLNWTMGPTLYSVELSQALPKPSADSDSDEPEFEPPTEGMSLSIEVRSDTPVGMRALVGGQVVTMAEADGGVIEDGVIVIEGNRIVAVGASGTVDIPAEAQIIDVSGRTVIPGLIDSHAHGPQGTDEIIPQQNWSTRAHLAFGVTTIFDPSSRATEIFAASELQRAGLQLAPRTYSTGEVVYGARAPGFHAAIDDFSDAKEHVFRLSAQGAHGVKNYNQPRREQRQQVVAAAHEAGLLVVAEGASMYHMDMALIADGNSGLEHNIPLESIYQDVLSMISQTKVTYSPTMVVTYGGLGGDPYWRSHMDIWSHPLLSLHVPPERLEASIRRPIAPESNYVDDDNAKTALQLAKLGVRMVIGAHGQQQGLAAHWELWSLGRGGASSIEALRAATIDPAHHLGFDADLGSLEVGKLADLVIINGDILADITQSDQIEKVMLNGRLYDAKTLNEEVTGDVQSAPYFWE